MLRGIRENKERSSVDHSQGVEDIPGSDSDTGQDDAPTEPRDKVALGHAERVGDVAHNGTCARDVDGHGIEDGVVDRVGDGADRFLALERFADQARDEGRRGG